MLKGVCAEKEVTMLNKNDKKIEWFKNAKLGLFIHWGLYAATEGYWNGKETPGIVEWIALKERIPTDEYEKLAKKMTCENFAPEKWAALAKRAGMRYCVFTAKHHEGFAMYDTKYDDYNIVKRSPYQKDIAKEITQAMRNEEIVPCFYYSQAIDFHEKNAMGNTWDNPIPEKEREFQSYINGKCKLQLKELLTNYGDIGLIWMDVPNGMTEGIASDLKAYIKGIQPKCLISGRIGGTHDMGDYGCLGDNQIPSAKSDYVWETASTMNDTWGYKRDDHNFKTPKDIIELLCDVVSKGANLLLNIGPDMKGNIPPESIYILNELADWMSVNSEAIHDTKETPFETDFSFGSATTKDNAIYLFVKNKIDEITVCGIKNKILSAEILGGAKLDFTQEGYLKIDLKGTVFNKYVTVVKLILDNKPEIKRGVFGQESGYILLSCLQCEIIKGKAKKNINSNQKLSEEEKHNMMSTDEIVVSSAGILENWFDESHKAVWEFEAAEPGEYEVVIYTITQKYKPWVGGHKVAVECNGKISSILCENKIPTGANRKYFSETGSVIGRILLNKMNRLELTAEKINHEDPAGLSISRIELIRVNDQK